MQIKTINFRLRESNFMSSHSENMVKNDKLRQVFVTSYQQYLQVLLFIETCLSSHFLQTQDIVHKINELQVMYGNIFRTKGAWTRLNTGTSW